MKHKRKPAVPPGSGNDMLRRAMRAARKTTEDAAPSPQVIVTDAATFREAFPPEMPEPSRHDPLTKFVPADVPRLRDKILETCQEGGMTEVMLGIHKGELRLPVYPGRQPGQPGRLWTLPYYMEHLREWLAVADLFYVTEEMTGVVRQAAAAQPRYEVHRDRIPASVGFVVWADSMAHITSCPDNDLNPGEECRIVAALWAEVEDTGNGPGMHVVTFQDMDVMVATREEGFRERGLDGHRGDVRMAWGKLGYHDEYPLPYGSNYGERTSDPTLVRNIAVAGVMSTWIMMSQRLTETVTERVPRGLRRQYERAGRPEPEVRTVTMRRTGSKPTQEREPGQESSRTYKHRWVVGGLDGYTYWRNTWYPSAGEHRLQLVHVPPYVKGPEGAPMLDKPKVNVLRKGKGE